MELFKLFLLPITFISLHHTAHAQRTAMTRDGDIVLLYDNGTWNAADRNAADTSAVDCTTSLQQHSDKMTGKNFTSAEAIDIAKTATSTGNAISILLVKMSSGTITFGFSVAGNECIKKDSDIMFLLRDGTRLNFKNEAKFNCDGKVFFLFYDEYKKYLNLLSVKEIETIRIITNKSYIQHDITTDESAKIKSALQCLINDGK